MKMSKTEKFFISVGLIWVSYILILYIMAKNNVTLPEWINLIGAR